MISVHLRGGHLSGTGIGLARFSGTLEISYLKHRILGHLGRAVSRAYIDRIEFGKDIFIAEFSTLVMFSSRDRQKIMLRRVKGEMFCIHVF